MHLGIAAVTEVMWALSVAAKELVARKEGGRERGRGPCSKA